MKQKITMYSDLFSVVLFLVHLTEAQGNTLRSSFLNFYFFSV